MPRPVSPRMVMGVLSDIWQTAADKVGKIRVIDDPKIQGACFDLPVDVAKELLTKPLDSENIIEAIKQVHYSAKLNRNFCSNVLWWRNVIDIFYIEFSHVIVVKNCDHTPITTCRIPSSGRFLCVWSTFCIL
jgi:hypothetical protein